MLAHRCRSIGGDELKPGMRVIRPDHHNRMRHRVMLTQCGNHSSHTGTALANLAVDSNYIATTLIDDRVKGQGSLAGLSITQNQLSLAATDRYEAVDDFNSSL